MQCLLNNATKSIMSLLSSISFPQLIFHTNVLFQTGGIKLLHSAGFPQNPLLITHMKHHILQHVKYRFGHEVVDVAILRVTTSYSENEVARICQHLQHLEGKYRTAYTEQMGENAG